MNSEYIGCELGKRIANLRREHNLTQTQLAEKADISPSCLGKLERGEQTNANINTIFQIAGSLKTALSDLFYGIEVPDLSWENNINDALYQMKIDAACYPPRIDHYAVSNLMQFLIYLPLIPPLTLCESLRRIGGSIKGNEPYVLYQINHCIKRLPQTPAKDFADMQAKQLRPGFHISEMPDIDLQMATYNSYASKLMNLHDYFTYLSLLDPPKN